MPPKPDNSISAGPRHPAGRFHGYAVCVRRVNVRSRAFELLAPAHADRLADDPRFVERFEQDEYMPYWAELWSSSLLLAEQIDAWENPASAPGPVRVLDLGCGLGLAGMVAAAKGFDVTFADYDLDALAFAAENARRNGVPAPHVRRIDWREEYTDLRVDRIVAADVLYETRSLRSVAEFVQRHLAAGGEALLADPQRSTAESFEQVARHCGLAVRIATVQSADLEGVVIRGRMFHLRHKELSPIER